MGVASVDADPALAADRRQMDEHADAVPGRHRRLDLLVENLPLLEERVQELLDLVAALEAVASRKLRALLPDGVGTEGRERALDVPAVERRVRLPDRVGRRWAHR